MSESAIDHQRFLAHKLLEMELRMELEKVTFPGEYGSVETLASYEVDRLAEKLLPFVENQIRLAKEGQR